MNAIERSRTITWDDPMATAAPALTMSGIDFYRAIERGEVPRPPIGRLMGIDQGRVTQAAGKLYAHGTTTCLILRSEDRPVGGGADLPVLDLRLTAEDVGG